MILLADVMGHGRPAADTVTALRTHFLLDPLCHDRRPEELLGILDDFLESEFIATGRFVSALALLIAGPKVEAANAGIPDPQIGDPPSWQMWPLPPGSLLGLRMPGAAFQQASTTLLPGHFLLAFSDGVAEAGRGKSSQFQHGPLQAFLSGLPTGATAAQLVTALFGTLRSYVGPDWPEDDATVVCLLRL